MSTTTNIFGGTFLDVRGNLIEHNQQAEEGLKKLLDATSEGAAHDSLERDPPPKCHPDTRKEVLARILKWVEGSAEDKKILWLYGPAGAGKSSIAQSIAEACVDNNSLAASFFFSRVTPPRDTVTHFFATIAYQIAVSSPDKRVKIGGIVERDPLIVKKALRIQLKKLIIEPFKHSPLNSGAKQPPHTAPFLVVIDGLDECKGDDTQTEVLRNLTDLVTNYNLPLRFLIATRPEPHIRASFNAVESVSHVIHLDEAFRPKDDVHIYLTNGFKEINRKHSESLLDAPKPWPTDGMLESLVDRSGGMFVYAATVLRFIDDEDGWPADKLESVLSSTDASAFTNLDNLYQEILGRCTNIPLVLKILGCVIVARGISPSDLETLLGLRTGEVRKTLRRMHSLLDIPDMTKPNAVIHVLHASFPDFIFNSERAGKFCLDYKECHGVMGRACMKYKYFVTHDEREPMKYVQVNGKYHYDQASEWVPGVSYDMDALRKELEESVGSDVSRLLIGSKSDEALAKFILKARWMMQNYDYVACPYRSQNTEDVRKDLNEKMKGNPQFTWAVLMGGILHTERGFRVSNLIA